MNSPAPPVPAVESVVALRNQRVILDADLAALYGVKIRQLNEQIKRNLERVPTGFMFRLTAEDSTL